jgi:hypothetical protein
VGGVYDILGTLSPPLASSVVPGTLNLWQEADIKTSLLPTCQHTRRRGGGSSTFHTFFTRLLSHSHPLNISWQFFANTIFFFSFFFHPPIRPLSPYLLLPSLLALTEPSLHSTSLVTTGSSSLHCIPARLLMFLKRKSHEMLYICC